MREFVCTHLTTRLVAPALAAALSLISIAPPDVAFADARSAAKAETVAGPARIIDGDTLDIAGERVRLYGIDAPEAGQTCPGEKAATWHCGEAASRHLRELAQGAVTCKARERDAYGRLIGTCFSGGRNINALMVREGYAWAFVKYASDYTGEEREAKAAKLGIWAASAPAQPAWDYRQQRWTSATETAPQGCAIKGNISGGDRIYHVPWSPWYDKVSISAERGERWFCNEAEAVAAGWRPARFE